MLPAAGTPDSQSRGDLLRAPWRPRRRRRRWAGWTGWRAWRSGAGSRAGSGRGGSGSGRGCSRGLRRGGSRGTPRAAGRRGRRTRRGALWACPSAASVPPRWGGTRPGTHKQLDGERRRIGRGRPVCAVERTTVLIYGISQGVRGSSFNLVKVLTNESKRD